MTLRVLVCDDEPIAVSRMVALLSRIPEVEIVGTAPDSSAALAAIQSARPDLIILDIEMPGPDGFELVRLLEGAIEAGTPAPLITFVTAYRQLAPEAFDSGAIDFLSKPVRPARLEQSIARARSQIAARNAEVRLAALESEMWAIRAARLGGQVLHVWVQRRGEVVRVDLDAIDRVTAEGPYVRLHANGATYLYREAIGSMEERLSPLPHIRVHRSHIVRGGPRVMHSAYAPRWRRVSPPRRRVDPRRSILCQGGPSTAASPGWRELTESHSPSRR